MWRVPGTCFTVRLADQTTAGSQIPESHEEPRRRSAGGSQLTVGAEFRPRHQHCSQLVTQENGRSLQPWWCWSAGIGNRTSISQHSTLPLRSLPVRHSGLCRHAPCVPAVRAQVTLQAERERWFSSLSPPPVPVSNTRFPGGSTSF